MSNEAAGKLEVGQEAYVRCIVTGSDTEDGEEWISLVTPDGRDIEVKRERVLASAPPQVTGEQVQTAIKKVLGRVARNCEKP